MNKYARIALIVAVVLAAFYFVAKSWTKSHSPSDTAEISSNGLTVTVAYCQPAVKGRTIFGELVPYNRVWRTGANEATVITFNKDVTIAGTALAAGEYTLWTRPTASDWGIIFNSQTGQWGTQYAEESNVIEVNVPSSQVGSNTELFEITFTDVDTAGVNMNLKWDNTLVEVPIQ